MSDAPSGDPAPAEEPASLGPVELAAAHYGVPASLSRAQLVLHPPREQYLEVVGALKEAGYAFLSDVTATDYLVAATPRPLPEGVTPERFEVVANLLNHRERVRIRVRVQVPADDPRCPSLWPLHAGSESAEREVFDMFGITFDDHPDLTRILMPESWEGHPLRKDHAVGRIPVQFKDAPASR